VHADWRGYALGLAGVAVFSVTLPATRLAVQQIDPWAVAFGRMAVAGLIAGAMLLALGERLPDRPTLARLAIVATGVVLGFPLFSTLAMQTVDASHGGVVLAVLPLATAVVAAVRAGERPTPAFWLWALLGTLLVLAFALLRGRGHLATGDLFLLLAGVLAAIGYAEGGVLARARPGLVVIGWALVLTLPAVLPVGLLLLPRVNWSADAAAWAAFLYVAIGSQFLGFYFWYKGLALGGIARIGQVQLLQTFLTLGCSAVLLGETIDKFTLIFALATVLCVWAGRRARA
jgi:drug/metabolite transporter (DMT)-like permease